MLSIYKASAGSGKTHTLTREYLVMLFRDYQKRRDQWMPHSRILAVTFTKKATAEMKERILQALYTLSTTPEDSPFYNDLLQHFHLDTSTLQLQARQLLIAILKDYNHFSVSTIDGFFQQVIRTFALDLGLSTTYDIALDGDEVIQQAVDDIFRRIRQQQEGNTHIISWITDFAKHNMDDNANGNLHRSISDFSKQLNKEEVKRHIGQLQEFFKNKENIKQYQALLSNIITNTEKKIVAIQRKALPLIDSYEGIKADAVSAFRKPAQEILEKGLNKTFVKVLEQPESLCLKSKTTKAQQAAILSLYETHLCPLYHEMANIFDKEIIDYYTAIAISQHLYTIGLLQDVADQVSTTNRQIGRVPISDVNMLIHDVIDGQETPFIYERMGQYLHHFMIDEFQDTSSLQWQNFYPLINEAESKGCDNLIVGDVKQSIYRWRNSDWKLLNGVHSKFANVQQPPMIDNWRSAKVLIQENEQLIGEYAKWVATYFTNEGWNEESPLAQMAMSIYHTDAIHQEAQKDYPGVFQLQFIDAKNEDLLQQTLQAVDLQLQALRQEGWEWNKIAMLVRRGNDAELLARYLIEKGYPVESAEGMRIQSHPAVQLLVTLMQQHVQPHNEVVQYAIHTLHAPFTKEQASAIHQAFTLPLYEAVQQLITLLQLPQQAGALPYLTAFQDQVYQFTQKRVSDIGAFLEYWEKKAPKATIPSSPVVNAIRILTIHSSKGLEFDIVMLPFLNWDIQRTHMGEVFWCQPQTAPFNQMPLVAVPLSSKLLKTHFKKEYINEIISQYIDNLNLTYVAFTRPKMRLYAYGQMYTTTKDNKPQISKISHLLSYLYDQVIAEDTLLSNEENIYTYIKADATPIVTPATPDKNNTREAQYISSPIGNRLILRSRAEDDFADDTPLETIDLGILMHEWLAQINTWQDAQPAIDHMIAEGRITPAQQTIMQQQLLALQQLLQREGKEHWFTQPHMVRNEMDILTTTGKTQRPDRVMIDGKTATVIDYKFGHEHPTLYQEQLRNYTLLLQQMGYAVEAYLVYVAQQKIEQIQ